MSERNRWQLVAWAVVGALVVFAGVRLLVPRDGGSGGDPPPISVDRPGAKTAGGARRSPRRARIYVHVAGAVRRPGLYAVPKGARIARAIASAGGTTARADPTATNLAQKLIDGQQVLVAVRGQAPVPAAGPAGAPSTAGGASAAGAPAAPVSLATATVAQLDEVEGIGPTLAQRIVEYRDEHGGFRSVGQLQEVDGIGAKRFDALKDGVAP